MPTATDVPAARSDSGAGSGSGAATLPAAAYQQRLDRALVEVAQCEARARQIGFWRLIAFFLALGAATAAYEGWPHGVPGWSVGLLAAAALVAFILLVMRHDAVLRQRDREALRVALNRRGLRRLDGSWVSDQPAAKGDSGTALPYAGDLDVLGPASLWQRCDATTTLYGERALHTALGRAAAPSLDLQPARAVQAAVRELSPLLDLRQDLEVSGRLLIDPKGRKPDPEPFARWAAGPPLLPLATWMLLVLPLLTVPTLIVQLVHPIAGSGYVLLALLAVQLLVVLLTGMRVNALVDVLAARERGVAEYAGMLGMLSGAPLQAPANQALQAALRQGGSDAVHELGRLYDLVGYLDLRRHPLMWIPINVILLWDLFFALAIGRWQGRTGPAVRGWLEALGEVEARSSLAGLHFDNPDWGWPELVEAPSTLSAQGLSHPLLTAGRRVGNDVTLPGAGKAWLITGSNMSGKSTLLRSIGLLQVLAWAGGPVCARAARLSPMRLRTVVRVDDNVLKGVSHFYAELQRLKETLDESDRPGAPLCYLLDEILHGTNTRERELGARLVVKTLCRRGATGAVSTHDLSLASLEPDTQGAVRNVHFTELVQDGQMTFDYILRSGPVQTTNALRLMRLVGIDLDWDAEPGSAESAPSVASAVAGPEARGTADPLA